MLWHILPHASACIASGRIVLLDVRLDRYFIVPAPLDDVFARWLEAGGPPPAGVAMLLQRGSLHRTGDPEPAVIGRDDVTVPMTLDAMADRPRRIGVIDRSRVAALVAATWGELRTRPLHTLLQRHRRNAQRPQDPTRQRDRAGMFEQVRHSLPIARNCLLDSLAMARWFASGDMSCRLVFGVSTTPFAAHCWLQGPTAILNDSYDQVSRYTPILAL